MSELPDDITARIAALLAFERDVAMLPGSAVAKRSRDHARAALDAVILKHIRGEWRPMSEAPQKGRLLAIVDDEVRVIAYRKTSHVPIYGWCLADQGAEEFDLCEPTGWMPMPMPSTDLGREENYGRGQ